MSGMGVITLSFQIFFYSLVFALFMMVMPGIPPHLKFDAYQVRPPRKMEGKLTPNDILDRAELVIDGEFRGPESLGVLGDEVYTGIDDGHIIKVDAKGKWTKLVKLGGHCDGSWKTPCARPLGVRFSRDGKLIVAVADGYKGIHEVDITTGKSKQIVSITTKMSDGIPVHFPDDVDVDNEGNIYFTDASKVASLHNPYPEVLGDASGRLIKFDPKTQTAEVLIDGIHFANGVQLSRQEDFIVICETMRSRLLKYHLKGPKKGMKESFVEGLPGMPDNVRSNGKGGFYISLVMVDTEENPNQLRSLLPLPSVRKLILRVQHNLLKVIEVVEYYASNPVSKMVHNFVSQLGPMGNPLNFPRKVIIVDIDETGNIVGSLQNKNGKMGYISEIGIGEKYTYFGTPYDDKLWRIKTEYLA